MPTRLTFTIKSIFDLIFTTLAPELMVSSGTDAKVAISDHFPVYIKKKSREHHPKEQIHVCRKALYNKGSSRISCWMTLGVKDTGVIPQQLMKCGEKLFVIVTGCLNVLCPLKKVTVRQDQPDWFDGELGSAINTKFSLFKKACSSGQEKDWTSIKKHVCILTL